MADNPNAHKVREPRARKDIHKTVRSPREKVTRLSVPREDAALAEYASALEPDPEWSAENVASEAAAVNYAPAVGETRVIPIRNLPPGAVEAAIVSSLVSLAKFARRKPGTSLALAAAAGLAAGICLRRV